MEVKKRKKENAKRDGSPVRSTYIGKKLKKGSRWNKNRLAVK